MRNLKKLLALVVACVMVFGMVASAAVVEFPDVAVTAKYAEAVKVLSALNVINGDDKGNFNPDQNVTRAEMAKILCALLSKNATFGQTDSGFADVTAAHWASGYVKHAKGLGYINGYDATTFGPEDNVTYEQAIKLIVAALGYTLAADANGGYPAGYMMIAADKNITKNVVISDATAPAKRSDIALLAFNALTVGMMKRDTYGTSAEYKEGNETLLWNKLGTWKFTGTVVSTYEDAPATYDAEMGMISFDRDRYYDAETDSYINPTAAPYACEDPTAPDFRGYANVTAYLTENDDGDTVIIAITAKANRITEYVFDDVKVLADDNELDGTPYSADNINIAANGKFTYWSSADHSDKRPTVLEIDDTVHAYKNAQVITFNRANLVPAIGSIAAYDTDGDDKLDLFKVTEYAVAVVDSVNANSMRIRFKSNDVTANINSHNITSLTLNPDLVEYLKDVKVTIDGEAAEFTDLQENDVVYICANDSYTGANKTFLEIIASRKTVEGKAMSTIDTTLDVITIGSEEYKTHDNIVINIGEEGKFFLSADGTIVAKDTSVVTSQKYAYVYKIGQSAFGDKSVRLFTAEGEDVTYDVSDRIEINGRKATVAAGTAVTAKSPYTAADLVAIFGAGNDTAAEIFTPAYLALPANASLTDANICAETIVDAIVNGGLFAGTARENKLVAYEVSANAITELFLNKYAAYGAETETSLKWQGNMFVSGTEGKILASGAKIFMIPAASADITEWKAVDAATLVANRTYPVALFGKDSRTAEYSIALIDQSTSPVDTEAAFAYFKKSIETVYGADDEKAWKVTFIQGGEEKVAYVLDSNLNAALKEGVDADGTTDFAAGTVFMYTTKDDVNVIDTFETVMTPFAATTLDSMKATIAAGGSTACQVAAPGLAAFVGNHPNDYMTTLEKIAGQNDDNEVYFGVIGNVAAVEGGLELTIATDAGNIKASSFKYVVGEKANVVVLDYTKTRILDNFIAVGSVDSIQPSNCPLNAGAFAFDKIDANDNSSIETAELAEVNFQYALVRMLNDEVVDVLVINHDSRDL